jgi:hypothetical protein
MGFTYYVTAPDGKHRAESVEEFRTLIRRLQQQFPNVSLIIRAVVRSDASESKCAS